MEKEPLLMIPGPVPMPERVRYAMLRQAINHRGAEFGAVYADIVRVLRMYFGTTNDLFVLSGSGTAAMEAAIGNFGAGRKIVSLVNGKFGERLGKIGQRYGTVEVLNSEWGTPLDLAGLDKALVEGAEMVTFVHNETSTGIRNPAAEIAKMAKKAGALVIMDGITSIGGDEVKVDTWGVDVAFMGSQKCFAAPAGLSAISVSKKAWDMLSERRPYYLDLAAYRKSAGNSPMETPYTPAVALFLALREALLIAETEGVEARIARHRKMADAVRAAVAAWGLPLFPKTDALHAYSNTATAVSVPAGVAEKELRTAVKGLGIEIAGGQDHLKGKIFRIGHMGAVGAPEILAALAATEYGLGKAGWKVKASGITAAAGKLA
jgi:aspartate aminotransferase-like enzyme